MTTPDSLTRHKPGAERQQKLRDGTSRKLDRIIDELSEQSEKIQALVSLLGIELQPPEQRR